MRPNPRAAGLVTNVPLPGTFTSSPSSARTPIARRTVIDDRENSSCSAISGGIFRPGAYSPDSIRSRRISASCKKGNSAAPWSIVTRSEASVQTCDQARHDTPSRALACFSVLVYVSRMNQLDTLLGALERSWPGWHVWYVRNAAFRTITWCALADAERDVLPMRTLNADTPEELSAAMGARTRELIDR